MATEKLNGKRVEPRPDTIKAWQLDHWGGELRVDVPLESARADDFDALLLRGGHGRRCTPTCATPAPIGWTAKW